MSVVMQMLDLSRRFGMVRRRAMRSLWLLSLVLVPSVAHAQAGASVLVLNSAEASLSVLDVATRTERTRIPVLREPHHVALTPDGADLLVGDTSGNQLLFLDPVSFDIKRRMTMSDPYQLGFSRDSRMLVVTGIARAQVDVYEAGTYKLLHRFPLQSMPSHMDFTPDSSVVYVSLQGTGKLAALDLRNMTVLWEADVGKAPAGVMWHDGRVMVAIMGSDNVAVVNPANGAVERRIRTGRGAHQLFRSPDEKLIYVNNRIDGTSVTLDARTLAVVRTYPVPGGPDDLVFAPDGKVWYTLRFVRRVGILDPRTGALDTIDVGRSPHGIFITTSARRTS
jgi:YVTN family beta-propeller protein